MGMSPLFPPSPAAEQRAPPAATASGSAGARAAAQLGAMLLVVAGVFDAEPLYVPGVALLALAAGCLAWVVSGSRGISVGRTLPASCVVEGEALAVAVELRSSRVALPSCLLVDPLLEAPLAVRGGRRAVRVDVQARFARRGRHALAPPTVVVGDPLGLARRAIAGDRTEEVLVLPRVEPVRAAGAGAGRHGTAARRRAGIAPAAEIDVDGLRPHREGAPASRIHWPAFARSGELLERRLRPEGDSRPVVALDTRGEDPDAADAAVRAAASLCVALAGAGSAGGCAVLLPGERRPVLLEPGLSGWPHLHARLAVVEAGAPVLSGLATRRGSVFYVSARPLRRPPAVLTRAPASGRFLVVPGAPGVGAPAFTVAGCTGYDLAPARPRGAAA